MEWPFDPVLDFLRNQKACFRVAVIVAKAVDLLAQVREVAGLVADEPIERAVEPNVDEASEECNCPLLAAAANDNCFWEHVLVVSLSIKPKKYF